jgi:hypothetical protein
MTTQQLLTQAQSELVNLQAQLAVLAQEETEAREVLEAAIEAKQAEISALSHKLDLETRIEALGEVDQLVAHYFGQAPAEQRRQDDAWNSCAFCAAHIESNFGWHFSALQKPTLAQLEQIKVELS